MSVVAVLPNAEDPEGQGQVEALFTKFLSDLTTCKSLVEVNIAAGIALEVLNTLHG